MAWLTKSRFLSGLQCHKRLWFEIHQPLEEQIEPSIPILQGRTFDEAVQRLRPGVAISRDSCMPAAIAETARILAKGPDAPSTLYQPAFRAGDFAVIADVLRRKGNEFELVEVKATTQVKEIHLPDAAFQALVLRGAGVPVGRVFIGHVNNQFVLRHVGEYDGLLVEEDITDAVENYLAEAAARASEYQPIMASPSTPSVSVGPQCKSPYECPFLARCSAGQKAPEYPVDSLPRGGKTLEGLIADGYRDLREVPVERLTSELHRRVHEVTTTGAAYFDATAATELRQLPPPYSYLDFETISLSVSEVIGTRPYEKVPFQWSVHVEIGPTDIRHAEYLAIESFGDFDGMARALIAAIPPDGPIFAYNASFEAAVLNGLADRLPNQDSALRGLAGRLVDLLPITREAYYHRDMQGSWSIKDVMPTILPELGYERLDEVQEGGAAQLAFLELRDPKVSPERAQVLRSGLLRYCAHDTWVMVVLRRFLCGESVLALDQR
jgi:hypothetical protein